ncbi:ATP-binding protein [Streptomyces rhizosphaerihabitans]|uniref:ATP-binding protein n=1 Tax=Streptomyces rhizosphaerihabitans TaxID=1266770 RepID=UPI0021BEBB05|nr:ATP-binding protein [Streptomyces rhizosphaerihabitans]MCT9011625.1 ATP-binding protein [Streptomyces rhizosphaerihabitans]
MRGDEEANNRHSNPSPVLGEPASVQSNLAEAGSTVYAVQNGDQTVNNFFGATGPSLWIEPDEYLHRVNRGSIYSHRWKLVGRAAAMESLLSFAGNEQGRVALLVGRGGVGKTKVLTSLCETLVGPQSPVEVRVLDPDSGLDPEAFKQLPSTGKLLVIVDDAHSETLPLGKIIAGVQDANCGANVLLSLRPYGVAHTRRALAQTRTHASEALVVEIGDLEFDDALSLAGEILDEAVRGYAPRLATAAWDCPLLIVTGAALINSGSLDPRGFEGDEQLHLELTDRLAEALTADSASEQVRQDLLCALAAFQPVHLAEPEVQASLEAITGLSFDLCVPHLSALEGAGVLLSHGKAVRVVPDLLGDALLVRAARHSSTGLPTGYLIRAMDAAQGSALANLVVNAGRVDWQQQAEGADGLIEPVWAQIAATFRAADACERVSILEVLAKVAFFQPRRTLDLASWAVDNPCVPVTVDVGFGLKHTYTDTNVVHALARVLQATAYHSDFLPQAAALLWALGRDDARPTHQHPLHPVRILEEVASFTRLGPTDRQRILIAQVERWLGRARDVPSIHQPLGVLAPILATEGQDEVWTPSDWTLTFRPYVLLPAPQVLEVREAVLDLAFQELGRPQLERASAAVSAIGAALNLPQGGFGLAVTADMHQPWIPHLAGTLDRLLRYIVEHTLVPAILIAVCTELRGLAQYGSDDLRQPAMAVLGAIPTTLDNELARALHGGPADPATSSSIADWHEKRESFFVDIAAALDHWTDDEIAERIDSLLGEDRRVFGADDGRARPFISTLVTNRPSLGEALCERARHEPLGVLVSLVSVALNALGRVAGDRVIHWGRVLLGVGNVELAREVAHAIGIQCGRTDLLAGEADLLRELAAHEDSTVRMAALGAIRSLAAQHKDLVIELLTASPAQQGAGIDEFALAVSGPPYGSLTWSDLSIDQQNSFLDILAAVPKIDSYEIGQFLAKLARTEPLTVVKLLEQRVENSSKSKVTGYFPLPHAWQVAPPFRDHEEFQALLRQICEWLAADPDSAWKNFVGADVFALVAGSYDEQVTAVMDEYLSDADPTKVKVVATILRKAPRELVWDPEFVRRCLRAADSNGDESLNRMKSSLHAAVITGMRSTSPGQPYPEDIEQRAKATALADTCRKGSVEEQFYRALAESAQERIQQEVRELPPDSRSW